MYLTETSLVRRHHILGVTQLLKSLVDLKTQCRKRLKARVIIIRDVDSPTWRQSIGIPMLWPRETPVDVTQYLSDSDQIKPFTQDF